VRRHVCGEWSEGEVRRFVTCGNACGPGSIARCALFCCQRRLMLRLIQSSFAVLRCSIPQYTHPRPQYHSHTCHCNLLKTMTRGEVVVRRGPHVTKGKPQSRAKLSSCHFMIFPFLLQMPVIHPTSPPRAQPAATTPTNAPCARCETGRRGHARGAWDPCAGF